MKLGKIFIGKLLIKCLGIDIIEKKGDKMKLKRKILMVLFWLTIVMGLNHVCYAGTQRLNSIDYDVQLNGDGSMDVIETWDIYIDETNTVFKDFELDQRKYSGITDVKVKNLDTGMDLTQIYEEMYHVTKDCYYGLPIPGGKFEIAWGVGLDDSSDTRKYQISYTVEDVISVYQDCSELYWQFIGVENGMPAKKVTGTIQLPSSVEDIEKLRVWAHGPLNGEIRKVSNNTINFGVDDLQAETMVEVRIVVEEEMFLGNISNSYQNKLDTILAEEMAWAEEANQERKKAKTIFLGVAIVYGIVLVFFGKKVVKHYKELKAMPKRENIDIGEYFRDIPREKDATPAEAAFLQDYPKLMKESNVFSATLLQLCLKGYLSFEKEGKKDICIRFLKPMGDDLKESERIVYQLLTEPEYAKVNQTVTMDEIEKWAKRHYDEFNSSMVEMKESAKNSHISNGNYDLEMEKKANRCAIWIAYFFVIIWFLPITFSSGMILPMLPLLFEWIACVMLLMKKANRIPVLTDQGEIEKQQWKGLKKYMEDFSLLKERDIPDLILWEKYLVYATAFGISDKVIDQLKVAYPQMQNLDNGTYTYLYLMADTRFSNGFIHELNQSTNRAYSAYESAYQAAHSSSSSGSGGGGGFSGGGGGRWWRWPEWEEDKMKIGIDIGGSHIGIGLIEGSKIVDSREKNFNREDKKQIEKTILNSIQEMIKQLLNANQLSLKNIELIGIAAPGTISNGTILNAGNLNIEKFAILSELKKNYEKPLQIRNDGKCAALAEKAYGAMKDYEDCVFVNIGTGIGGAAFLGGKLLEPKRYSGFEFGHMVIEEGGRLCSCGKKGCFETYASIKALKTNVTQVLDRDSDISGQFLREELLVKEDSRVKEQIAVFLRYLRTGIGNLIDIFEPEIVCLGGSFAYYEGHSVWKQLIESLRESGATFNGGELPRIVAAKLKNDAGMIGAVIE